MLVDVCSLPQPGPAGTSGGLFEHPDIVIRTPSPPFREATLLTSYRFFFSSLEDNSIPEVLVDHFLQYSALEQLILENNHVRCIC